MTLPADDLETIVERHADDFRAFSSAHIFITGATGFVGSWIVESLAHANARLGLGVRATVLARDPEAFSRRHGALARQLPVTVMPGSVETLPVLRPGVFDAVVHAATPASATLSRDEPLAMLDTIVGGGRSVLELARRSGRIPLLFTSSGAVYGVQPQALSHVDEGYAGAPDALAPASVYHEGKRVAELTGAIYARDYGVAFKVARLFAFAGPLLPLDRHFAIGNFMLDALEGRPISILGDGTALRSYLYAADMTGWLWRIFARGETGRAYNVGSERALDLASVARMVAAHAGDPAPSVTIAKTASPGARPDRYVPSTLRARTELGLEETVSVERAIEKTLAWHRAARAG